MDGAIVVTGASGHVASMILPYLRERTTNLRLTDRVAGPEVTSCELADTDGFRRILKGSAGVIHLGGQANEADWETVAESNIEGAVSLFEAVRLENVPRIVFASSNHAVGYYPVNRPFGTADVFRPDSYYGASKVFGECLCLLYADKHGLRTFAIRIGTTLAKPANRRNLSTWIHPEDLVQLVWIGLTHPDVHAEIVYGVSNPLHPYFDNGRAEALGYRPAHHASNYADSVNDSDPEFDYIGGSFSELSDMADPPRTLNATHRASRRAGVKTGPTKAARYGEQLVSRAERRP